jgi:hypothetical protein
MAEAIRGASVRDDKFDMHDDMRHCGDCATFCFGYDPGFWYKRSVNEAWATTENSALL